VQDMALIVHEFGPFCDTLKKNVLDVNHMNLFCLEISCIRFVFIARFLCFQTV